MEFIDLKSQYALLENKINARIKAVLDSGKYILGPEVETLESKLQEYLNVKHAIGVANGTDALQLSLMAIDIQKGDIVVTTPFTFFATAEVIGLFGAQPVFVDIDPLTYNISPSLLEGKLKSLKDAGKKVKAVITVDLFGLPSDYDLIEQICEKYEVPLIEDAAQGFGGSIKTRMAGSFGHIATTSFFPAKPLGCYGDGGAVFTNDDSVAEKLKSLRVHGKGADKYDNVRIGLNSRLDTIQAAILLEKLDIFPQELIDRNRIANTYTAEFSGLDLITVPYISEGMTSSWAQYTIRVNDRARLQEVLKKDGIPSAVYYPTPLHLCTAFSGLGYKPGDYPESEIASNTVISLPMSPYLSHSDQEKVINSVRKFATK
jgi:dTDP-4-amino-4,6-dideoxygalactose transaminase